MEVKKKTGDAGPVTIARYLYDPEGNRIRAVYPEDGKSVIYHFDLTGLVTENPIVEQEADGTRRNYVYLERKLLAREDGAIGEGTKYWFLTDHLGSVRGVTDKDGQLVWWADYEAFGKVKATGGDGTVQEVPRFTGKAWDEKVGLYYFNARWYDAGLGRFVGEDPFPGDADRPLSYNRFTYCMNDPVALVDPLGLFAIISTCRPVDDREPHSGLGFCCQKRRSPHRT